VRVPADAVIPHEKLTCYLLVRRPWGDKAKYLARAAFTAGNPEALLAAIRDLAAREQAVPDGENEYGEFLRVDGGLIGPNGVVLAVSAIWLRWRADGSVHFVTLKPRREKRQ